MLMGFRPSPYVTGRMNLWAEEIVRGDPGDLSNVFRWDRIRLNLPGSPSFDPTLPWVSKVIVGVANGVPYERIAADFATFVDDIRAAGGSLELAWQVLRRVAALFNYLGIQDAPRKRRSPLKTKAGAWTGALQKIYPSAIVALTSQEKWDKAKRIVDGLLTDVVSESKLSLRRLLKERGFLVHLTMTYPIMVPYLKGLHLTVDGWRAGRDSEGWKMARRELEMLLASRGEDAADMIPLEDEAPEFVLPVPRLLRDLQSLRELLEADTPSERVIRAKTVFT
jgi:hypothetical protein